MTLISCDMMAEQTRNEKHASTSTVEPCEGKAFVSSDDAYVDDNKTDLETPSRSVYFLSWRFEMDTPITGWLVHWQASRSCCRGAALSRGFWSYSAMGNEIRRVYSHGRDTRNWFKIACDVAVQCWMTQVSTQVKKRFSRKQTKPRKPCTGLGSLAVCFKRLIKKKFIENNRWWLTHLTIDNQQQSTVDRSKDHSSEKEFPF